MSDGIYTKIKNRIEHTEEGKIFMTKDFADIANTTTVRKCLGRQTEEGKIRRVLNGVYEKPRYSTLLHEMLPTDPDSVAQALARNYHWTISPCGDAALNRLGLSTQVPAVWSYISDGPYREFQWDTIKLSFRHRANRELSDMSEITALVVEALKALGKEWVTEDTVNLLRIRLSPADKETLLLEARNTSEWIYETVRKVCE
ncbi:MAG: DUF6088 family protein [Lachnospiraceae bacterium]|nr:DUF6088 family protein [Lachnospiraceae bacterium]